MTDANGATHPKDCACHDCIADHIEQRAQLELKNEWLGIEIRGQPDFGQSFGQSVKPLSDLSETPQNRSQRVVPTPISVRTLCDIELSDVRFIVPEFIPEGVTLLAGRPKLGKSWLMLQVGSAVALGQQVLNSSAPAAHGDVLYLALEDNARRLQRRLRKYFGWRNDAWPDRLSYQCVWPRVDDGGIALLERWCDSVANPTLIMIDTLKKIRPVSKKGQNAYDVDYEACEKLVAIAHKYPGLGILVSHHDRKAEADDVFDTVSGTLGLTGGVDAIAMLKRQGSGGITLHIQGRDLIDNIEKAVELDHDTCRWTVLGDAQNVFVSDTVKAVSEVLSEVLSEGASVREIMETSGITNRPLVDKTLQRMAKDGKIKRIKRGRYVLLHNPTLSEMDL